MMTRHWRIVAALALSFVVQESIASADEEPRVSTDHARRMQEGLALFKERVRPALVRHCLDCHGGKSTKGEFDLSDRKPLLDSGMLEGGGREGRLASLIRHADEPHMPYKAAKLPDATIAEIVRWIDLGAPYDKPLGDRASARPQLAAARNDQSKDFWSFRPLVAASPPAASDRTWIRTPIDQFVRASLEERRLRPNRIADRRTLIRRVSLDLTGLPPELEDVEAFVHDPRPDAYERLVDRLLASPHHGERWARHWLDVARFAESSGYEHDDDRPYAYHYRDFVIRALNADLPYDRFAAWQLAGDEWTPEDPMAMAATGFLGAGVFPTQLTEAEFESARYNELDDMVATTGSAFLGLSVGCARCHDHKYDPIPSEVYYQLAAVFTTTIRSEVEIASGCGTPKAKVLVTSEGYPHTKHHADDRGYPHYYPKTYILRRGDVAQKQGEAAPGVIRILASGRSELARWKTGTTTARRPGASYRRSSLAAWLTDVDSGAGALAARVIVNRLWQHHFGRGIVSTPNDFGAKGSRPSHPELLDWLAARLIEGGWRLKPIHRLIVTSAVYMQDSSDDPSRKAVDPENLTLWRHAVRRLEAEPIRDAMLAVAGRLDRRMYGAGSLDPAMPRRSVYLTIKRSRLVPLMMLFDWPEHLVSIGQRPTTTTAPQALAMLNGSVARRCAEGLADRTMAGSGCDLAAAPAKGYRIALGRDPTESESRRAAEFVAAARLAYTRTGRPEPDRAALVDFCQALIGMNEFIYIP